MGRSDLVGKPSAPGPAGVPAALRGSLWLFHCSFLSELSSSFKKIKRDLHLVVLFAGTEKVRVSQRPQAAKLIPAMEPTSPPESSRLGQRSGRDGFCGTVVPAARLPGSWGAGVRNSCAGIKRVAAEKLCTGTTYLSQGWWFCALSGFAGRGSVWYAEWHGLFLFCRTRFVFIHLVLPRLRREKRGASVFESRHTGLVCASAAGEPAQGDLVTVARFRDRVPVLALLTCIGDGRLGGVSNRFLNVMLVGGVL